MNPLRKRCPRCHGTGMVATTYGRVSCRTCGDERVSPRGTIPRWGPTTYGREASPWRKRARARLARPQNRVSCAARARYAFALPEGTEYAGSSVTHRLRLHRDAALGWPINAVAFYRERFAVWTAEPGDELRHFMMQRRATVLRVRHDGLVLAIIDDERIDPQSPDLRGYPHRVERVDRVALGWQPVRRGGGLP